MARGSTGGGTACGRRPEEASSRPAAVASWTPTSDRATSTQPVNSPLEFHSLSPCRSSTRVFMRSRISGNSRRPYAVGQSVQRTSPRRIATISLHTSPLDQPGTGDAGGLNVYVVEVSKRLAARGTEVEIFTRAVSRDAPPVTELAPGVLVRHVTAGPFEELEKADMPAQICHFTFEALRIEAAYAPGRYDLVHGHYWLSGQVGAVAKERWGVPLVQSMHTLGKVKNAALATGDSAEPDTRIRGEAEVVAAADRLVANTAEEARQLIGLYGADPARGATAHPGGGPSGFPPGDQQAARRALGVPADAVMLLFAGRMQPLKGPDILLHAVARMVKDDPELARRLAVGFVGGPSGLGRTDPDMGTQLA